MVAFPVWCTYRVVKAATIAPLDYNSSLTEILNHSDGFKSFLEFSGAELNSENLLAWQRMETLKKEAHCCQAPSILNDNVCLSLFDTARKIFQDFIVVNAESEINISHELRNKIVNTFVSCKSQILTIANNSKNKLYIDGFEMFYKTDLLKMMLLQGKHRRRTSNVIKENALQMHGDNNIPAVLLTSVDFIKLIGSVFDQAQDATFRLMETNSLTRFLSSASYMEFLNSSV